MINILHIGLSNNPGGVENLISNYTKHIDPNLIKFDFLDIYGQGIAFSELFEELGCETYTMPNYKSNPLGFSKHFINIIKTSKYDIIHIHMQSTANILPIILALLFSKSIIIGHSHSSSTPKGLLRKILDKTNRNILYFLNMQKWACGKKAGKWMWGKKFNNKNIIPNAIDDAKYSSNSELRKKIREFCNFDEENKVIGFIGRFGDEKNPLFLVDILSELIKKSDKYRLLVVGDGDLYQSFQEKLKSKNLDKYCYTAGRQTSTSEWYQAMDAFLLPSFFEGFPMVAVESQSVGIPTFLSNTISTEIQISPNVFFISIKSAEDWANKIDTILKNKQDSYTKEFNNIYKINYASKFLENKYKGLIDERK